MFAIVIFWGMATASVFVVHRMPSKETHYRTWGYPLVPGLFLIVAGWIVLNALITAPRQALAGLGLIAIGVPFYLYWSRTAH
jgi:APA family basic amino acid/polyamine antiporter